MSVRVYASAPFISRARHPRPLLSREQLAVGGASEKGGEAISGDGPLAGPGRRSR